MFTDFRYYIPTKILFGNGILDSLHKEKLPGKKALIVMTAGQSAVRYGYIDRLHKQLDKNGINYVICNNITTNPTKDQVMEASKYAAQNQCDFVIGLGGGSCLDAAKAIAVVLANGGDLWDYFHGGTAKAQPVKRPMLPVVAITTTAGTGSETDQWMVISNPEKNEKIGFGYSRSFPTLAVVDPTLMVSVPPMLTAYHGLDALFHSAEGYISSKANPISDLFALKSISLIGKSLVKAVNEGHDLEARGDVALANTLSGMLLAITSLTAEHAMEDGLSGMHSDLMHGAGLVLISEAYYTHIAELGHSNDRMLEMAKALGMVKATEPMDFVRALVDILRACKVHGQKMSDFGIKKEEFPIVVSLAKQNASSEFYAEKKVLSDEECIQILEKSYI